MAKGVLWAVLLTVCLEHTSSARGQEVDCEDADDLEAVDLGVFRCKADEKAPKSRTSPDTLPLPGGGSVYRPAIGKPPVGTQEIKRHAPPTDAEKIESVKHLKRILGVYDARGVWNSKRGTERYTFIPSLAARKNPKLREYEEAEWEKLLAQHNEEKLRQRRIPVPAAGEPLEPPDQPGSVGTESAGASIPQPLAKEPFSPSIEPQGQSGKVTPATQTPSGEPVPGELWSPESLEQAKLETEKPRVTGGAPGVPPDFGAIGQGPPRPAVQSSDKTGVPGALPPREQFGEPNTPPQSTSGLPGPSEHRTTERSAQTIPSQPSPGMVQPDNPPKTDPAIGPTPSAPTDSPASQQTEEQVPSTEGPTLASASGQSPQADAGQPPPADSQATSSGEAPAMQPAEDQSASKTPPAGQPTLDSPPSNIPPEGAPRTGELPPAVLERLWTPEDLEQAKADGSDEKTASVAAENLGAQEESPPDGGVPRNQSSSSGEPTDEPSEAADPSEEAVTTEESNTGGQPAEPPSLLARLWQALESLTEGFWQSDSVEDDEIQGDSPRS